VVDADCADGDPCTADVCTAGACQNPAVVDGTSCADGDACNGNEVCQSGTCAAVPLAEMDALQCELEQLADTSLCSAASISSGLQRHLRRKVRQAQRLLRKAARANPRKASRLLKKAARKLRVLRATVAASRKKANVDDGCGALLDRLLTEARQRATGLANG
jgi:hypothetical protein